MSKATLYQLFAVMAAAMRKSFLTRVPVRKRRPGKHVAFETDTEHEPEPSEAEASEVETRKVETRKVVEQSNTSSDDDDDIKPGNDVPVFQKKQATVLTMSTNTYWLTRIIFIRSIAFIYFVAFLVAINQNKELIGNNGLLPVNLYLNKLREHFKVPPHLTTTLAAFNAAPSILWWVGPAYMDWALDAVAVIGLVLSGWMMVFGRANSLMFMALWLLYHSILNVGQIWYSFGWESQLLETGFLAIFMCPLVSLKPFSRTTPTPLVIVWGYRWLLFRIMLGAGLIKIRGDKCWRDLTCMDYHYETQPVPNPFSYYMHQSPALIHRAETLGNHIVELVVPFFIFLPRQFRIRCGILQIMFQVLIILSGNLSFLNWLTILPSIFCFDDLFFKDIFHAETVNKIMDLQERDKNGEGYPMSYYFRKVSHFFLGLLLLYLSIPVVQNLLSSKQMMNTSFDSLRIVNTYGAFGSVTKERTEVILEGTMDDRITGRTNWVEIEFKCKPGCLHRRPCIISPYHYRLDWLMWFSAFQNYQHNPWLLHLAGKILAGDPAVQSLLVSNYPFTDNPPKFVRAQHYKYQYTDMWSKEASEGQWWQRDLIGQYFPPVSELHLRSVLEQQGWKWYNPS